MLRIVSREVFSGQCSALRQQERCLSTLLTVLLGHALVPVANVQSDEIEKRRAWFVFRTRAGGSGSSQFGIAFEGAERRIFGRRLPFGYYSALTQFAGAVAKLGVTLAEGFEAADHFEERCFRLLRYRARGGAREIGRLYVAFDPAHPLPSAGLTLAPLRDRRMVRVDLRASVTTCSPLRSNSTLKLPSDGLKATLLWAGISHTVSCGIDGAQLSLTKTEDKMETVEIHAPATVPSVQVEISLGGIELQLDELLALRPGASIKFERPEEFEAVLRVAGQTWAEAQVAIQNDGVEVRVGKLIGLDG